MLKFLVLGVSLAIALVFIGWSGMIGYAYGQINCTNWLGLADKDCDQLANTWETSPYNGLNLRAYGADPNIKDIFLEIDYYGTHHKPRPGVIEAVTTAFQNSGVTNFISETGIRLHVFIDENMNPLGPDVCLSAPFPFSGWFGNVTERTPANAALLAAKRDTFHHALFIHSQCGTSSSGTSDTPGNQLVVSLGAPGWGTDPVTGLTVGSIAQQEGTLMHELGHNLNLLHGGFNTVNCKPNYISVMNWAFQFPTYIGNPFNSFPDYTWAFPDYSRWTSASLIENSLTEDSTAPFGIGNPPPPPAGVKTAIGGGIWPASLIKTLIPVGTPVNYNDDADTTDSGVMRNLNNFGYSGTASEGTCNSAVIGTSATPLVGHKDWGSTQWKFWGADSGWYPGSPPPPSPGAPINTSETKPGQIQMVSAIMNPPPSNQSLSDNLTFNHTDVTIEMVRTARLQLLQEINYNIQTLPDSAFVNTTSANTTRAYFEMQLIGLNNSIANLTQNDQLDKAIDRLDSLRKQMDFGFGGIKSDDLIIDVKAQAMVVPFIDNLKQVLISQM